MEGNRHELFCGVEQVDFLGNGGGYTDGCVAAFVHLFWMGDHLKSRYPIEPWTDGVNVPAPEFGEVPNRKVLF